MTARARYVSLGRLVVVSLLLMTGCRSTPTKPGSAALVDRPVEAVQKAAVNELVVTGLDVTRQEPLYVEGYRPRRWGVVVGSGGETVGIWLEPETATRTRVRIDTARTFAGGAGQKIWNQDVLRALERELERKE